MMSELAVAGGLLLLLLAGLDAGYRLGRRAGDGGEDPSAGQVGAIQGAVLGLLALLLGFSFSGAASRFIERQDQIVTEANAIGTAWLRADLLDEPHRSQLKDQLARYVAHRIEVSQRLRNGLGEIDAAEIAAFHQRIWNAASEGSLAKPATMVVVLPPVNEVIDMHATRVAAGRKHLPMLVLGLLIACSVLGVAVIGYGCGLGRRRALPMTVSLALLIGAALWTTIDLDYPRRGLIQLSDAPLRELDLKPARPATDG